jgi:heme exporter protein B
VTYLRQVGIIVWKDLVVEVRTGERTLSMAGFTVLVGILFNYAVNQARVPIQDVAAALMWMTLVFAGMLGLGRTFQLEAEEGAFQGILLSPAPKDAVFLGKVVANFVLLAVVTLLLMAVFGLFFQLDYGQSPLGLLGVLGLGMLGFVSLGTLFAAVSTGTTMKETLLPILLFPLLVPMIYFGATATNALLDGRPVAEISGNLRMLGAFALVAVASGTTLFRFVVEE